MEDYIHDKEERLREALEVSERLRKKDEEIRRLTWMIKKLRAAQGTTSNQAADPREGDGMGGDFIPRSAVSVFPEEIWKMIFDHLSDPNVLWNLCNTCQLFEDILRPWKTGWMLEQTLPYLYPHLPREKIVECRSVSRGWKKAVDGLLENHPSLHPFGHLEGGRDYLKLEHVCPIKEKAFYQYSTFVFGNQEFDDIPKKLENHWFPIDQGLNPFLGRAVGLELGRSSSDEQEDAPGDDWWTKLDNFLNQFGKDIWYLSLAIPNYMNQAVKDKLQHWLTSKLFQSLPNLESISINFRAIDLVYEEGSVFPVHSKLKAMSLFNLPDQEVDHHLSKFFSEYATQLSKISLNIFKWMELHPAEFPNLTELYLDILVEEDDLSEIFQAMDPSSLRQLQKLHLIFSPLRIKCCFEELLNVVNRFTNLPSFSTLCLGGNMRGLRWAEEHELREQREIRGFNSNPSRLKILEIDMTLANKRKRQPNFHFLLRCFPFLDKLVIFVQDNHWRTLPCPVNDIDLHPQDLASQWAEKFIIEDEDDFLRVAPNLFKGSMYESKIWDLMPFLQVVVIQRDSFTRKGYEEYREKNV